MNETSNNKIAKQFTSFQYSLISKGLYRTIKSVIPKINVQNNYCEHSIAKKIDYHNKQATDYLQSGESELAKFNYLKMLEIETNYSLEHIFSILESNLKEFNVKSTEYQLVKGLNNFGVFLHYDSNEKPILITKIVSNSITPKQFVNREEYFNEILRLEYNNLNECAPEIVSYKKINDVNFLHMNI